MSSPDIGAFGVYSSRREGFTDAQTRLLTLCGLTVSPGRHQAVLDSSKVISLPADLKLTIARLWKDSNL